MDQESVLSVLLLIVPLAFALLIFGVLRGRGMRTAIAGCVGIVAGLSLIVLFVAYSAARVLL